MCRFGATYRARALRADTDNYDPDTPQQCSFVDSFQSNMLALFDRLPPATGIFSPTCFVHCLSGQNTWYQLTVNGVSMQQAVQSWYFRAQPSAPPTRVVSACEGWNCVLQCGYNPWGFVCNMGTDSCVVPPPLYDSRPPPP